MNRIAGKFRDDVDVVPALLVNPHEGSYHDKKLGKRPKVTMTRDWSVEIPKGRPVVVIDNVIASGATWEAAQSVLPDADLVTLADANRGARKEVADADIKNLADFMRHPEPPMSMDAFKEKFGSRNIEEGDPRVMFRRGANAVTPEEDAAYMDTVKRGDGRVDVSKPYKVEDVAKERPYLKVNQATDSALSDSGQPEAALTKSPVAAARQSLDSLERIIANRPQKVQSVFGSLKTALENIENGKPVFTGGRNLTAKNFVTSMQALGFDRKEGAKSAYFVVNGELVARASDHSANAELFVQDGTDNNLSVVIRRPHSMAKRFNADDLVNVVEVVYTRADLDAHPEKLPYIVRDIAEFIATGEYHDTAGAMAYNYSGSEEYKAAARDRIYSDALARGDTKVAERMVREAAAKAMPNTKVIGEDGLPLVVYHSVGSWYVQNGRADFNVFDGSIAKDGFMFRGSEEWIGPDGWGARNANGEGRFIKAFLNVRNPLIVDAKGANYTRIPNPMLDKKIGYPESVVREVVDENKRQRNALQIKVSRNEITPNDPKFQPLVHSWEYYTRENGKYILPDGLIHVTNELSDENGERFDGVIVRNVDEGEKDGVGDDYITQDPYSIKSADPVTYDDAGNVIPLSQRFNAENPDIRFRRRYTPDLELQRMADLYGFTPEQADLYNRIVTGGSAQFFADTKAAHDLSRRGTISPGEQAAIDATTQGSAAQRTGGWFRFLTQKPAWNWLRERAQDSMISLRDLEGRLRIGKDEAGNPGGLVPVAEELLPCV